MSGKLKMKFHCMIVFVLFNCAHLLRSQSICDQSELDSSDDPEQCMNTDQILEHWGYPVEVHHVTTSDGYILELFRIPHGRPGTSEQGGGRPVLVNHGLDGSSDDWVNNLPHQSLGFILADHGYDVWLANNRGNRYSRSHVKYSPKEKKFWEFSWDEMSAIDLPDTIDYILAVNGAKKIDYIGHSQGTSIALALCSLRPDYANQKVRSLYLLAPVAFNKHISSPLKYLGNKWKIDLLTHLISALHWYEFGSSGKLEAQIANQFCLKHLPVDEYICDNVFLWISGFNTKYTNATRMPVYLAHAKSGTSMQDIVYWGQMIASGKFQRFNYGPEYPLENLSVPTSLFSGGLDIAADPGDVQELRIRINHTIKTDMFYYDFNHLDFNYGLGAHTQIYPIILDLLLDV